MPGGRSGLFPSLVEQRRQQEEKAREVYESIAGFYCGDLAECPFCGCPIDTTVEQAIKGDHAEDCYFHFIDHQNELDIYGNVEDRKKLLDAWNRRHESEAQGNRIRLLRKAVNTYGKDSQIRVMIEEMSELTKELCKLYRAHGAPETSAVERKIAEEMADVQIMLDQMKIIFGNPVGAEYAKLYRLAGKLGGWPTEDEV